MGTKDKRIDAYIAKSAEFAKPILNHIRGLVHKACPDAEETVKWGFPHFDYKGEMMCSAAAFKQHCAFNFWKASLLKDSEKVLTLKDREAMGHFGRITSLKDLPADNVMIKYIKEAARLNDAGIKVARKPVSKQKKEIVVPDYFTKAIAKNKKAKEAFDSFSPSHKREYVDWITDVKSEETRDKRVKTMIEWLTEGKHRMWKYERK